MLKFESGVSPKKMVRVLVYPNITFQKDLEKDSYIQVIKNQIRLLNELRDDLWFYMILPKYMNSLAFDNVTQYIMKYPTYPPTMRSHFDVKRFTAIVSERLDFDLVMSHLPEHTHAVKNVMYNVTHHTPPVFGYSHWFDVRQVVAWSKDSFLQNVTGLLEYERCYLNTQYQKDLVLNQAKETFNDRTIERLDDILTVQHLGVNEKDITDSINEKPKKIIVFNHRPDTYKHYEEFLALMDKLWQKRQDFKVWVPLGKNADREYLDISKGDKQWYYRELRNCCVGFSPKQDYGGWSVATTDGMMNGVPYVMYNDTYYSELWSNADFFVTDEVAMKLIEYYLDNPEYRNQKAQEALDWIRTDLNYKTEMLKMSQYIDALLTAQRSVGQTDKFKEILGWIKERGVMTKTELHGKLNWGRGIKWTPYRRALMNHQNVFDDVSEESKYVWVE